MRITQSAFSISAWDVILIITTYEITPDRVYDIKAHAA